MKRLTKQASIFTAVFLILNAGFFAQTEGVSIKTTASAPHTSAMLDVESATKGVLIPRVDLTLSTSPSPVSSPTMGLMVFNKNTAYSEGIGFYFWNATAVAHWEKINVGSTLWSKIGTSIDIFNTDGGKVVLGTTAATPVFNFEVLGSSTSNSFSCKFDVKNNGQLRYGFNDLNGEAGGGPGGWLTQKASTGEGNRYSQLYNDGEPGLVFTSYGKAPSTVGWNTIQANNNNLDIGCNGVLTVYTGLYGGSFSYLGASGMWMPGSDSTLKKNIQLENGVLSKIKLCKPVTYQFKTNVNGSMNHGFLAQELEAVFPELVEMVTIRSGTTQGISAPPSTVTKKTVNYTGLISVLVKAIQEQQALIDAMDTRLKALER